MPTFMFRTPLPVPADRLADDLLTMAGVNAELRPWVRMTAPDEWAGRPIRQWPTGRVLFTSTLLLFGWIPIDAHTFLLEETGVYGFRERSSSVTHRVWRHERVIRPHPLGGQVIDTVTYESRLSAVGAVLRPVFRAVFWWRHRRLRRRYG